jgi:hypothetical protein
VETANYIIEWILAGISIIGAIFSSVGWIKAKSHEKEAKDEAKKAKQYAENANEANLSAKEFHESVIKLLNIQKDIFNKQKVKDDILLYIARNELCKTSDIANQINQDEEGTFYLLEEMFKRDKTISAAGQARLDNPSLTWIKK